MRSAQLYTVYIPHCVSWTHIHQSVAIPLHSSLFLKVHSHGMGTPSHAAEWGRAEYMRLHLGDAHIMTAIHQWMIFPSWLIQWSWSLVSRAHTICTMYWVVCSLTIKQLILTNVHLCPIDCVTVCPASCLLVFVAQLLTCNLHCYNVYWRCIRGWLIQLLHHFISLIPRPFSCPALIACGVKDWMAWKNSPILGFLWNM